MVRRLRMASGLVLFAYVVTHFVNHSLGIVSVAAMEAMVGWMRALWTSVPGTLALYGAFLIHLTLAFYALYERRTLKLRPLEGLQYLLGFSIPLLAATHVSGTRINDTFLGGDGSHYISVLTSLWYVKPVNGIVQIGLLFVAWTHVCLGLWFWLRLRPWYAAARPYLYAAALLLPVLAFLGFVAGEREAGTMLAQDPGLLARILAAQARPSERPILNALAWGIRAGLVGAIICVLLARLARRRRQRNRGVSRITYPGGRWIDVPRGLTVLDASQMLGIPHTSICGGKGRCSTCRIRVKAHPEALPPPSAEEQRVLRRIGAQSNVRLACQLRPRGPLEVSPLLPSPKAGRSRDRSPVYTEGREREIVILFADVRDFTGLAETRLPYDVVFILNRYFQEMGQAIETAGGYVDKVIGDGVMALFGLDIATAQASSQALAAARLMAARLDDLNRALADDLDAPLRIGIGIHVGPAIIGDMGYGQSRSLTAVGDTVNVASRLEALSKSYGCELVVSEEVLRSAGLTLANAQRHEIEIRGRIAPVVIYAVSTIQNLPVAALPAPAEVMSAPAIKPDRPLGAP